jgi:hypothetical protein
MDEEPKSEEKLKGEMERSIEMVKTGRVKTVGGLSFPIDTRENPKEPESKPIELDFEAFRNSVKEFGFTKMVAEQAINIANEKKIVGRGTKTSDFIRDDFMDDLENCAKSRQNFDAFAECLIMGSPLLMGDSDILADVARKLKGSVEIAHVLAEERRKREEEGRARVNELKPIWNASPSGHLPSRSRHFSFISSTSAPLSSSTGLLIVNIRSTLSDSE